MGGGSRTCLHRTSISDTGCSGRGPRSGDAWFGCPRCRRHKLQPTPGHPAEHWSAGCPGSVAGEQRSTPHRTAGSDQGAATRVGRGKTRAAAVLCRPTRAGPGRAQGTYGRRQWTILRRRRIRSARNPSSRQDKALPPGSGAASSGERIHHCSRARTATSRITRARGRGRPNALITVVAHPAQAVDGGRAAGVAAARAFRPFNTPEPADAAPWVTELVTADAKRPPG